MAESEGIGITKFRNLLLGGLVLAAALPGAAWAQMRMAWQTGDISVQLSWALQNHEFEKNNLKVELQTFNSGPAILPALAAKDIDVAWMGDFPAVTGFANGLPIVVFTLQNVALSSTRIVANPKSGVTTLAGLKGKRIGVSLGSTGQQHILQALKMAGLTQQDVTLVNLAPGNIPAAYFADQIDVAVTWEPNIGKIEKAGAVRLATSQSLGLIAASVAVVRTDYLRDHAKDVAALLRIWDEADKAIAADHDAAFAPEAARLKMTVPEFDALVGRMGATFPRYAEQLTPEYFGTPGNAKNSRFYREISNTATLLLSLKRIDSVPANLDALIDVGPMSRYIQGH